MPVKIEILVSDKEAAARIKKFAKQAGGSIEKLEKKTVASSKKMSSAFKGIGSSLGALGIGLGVGVAVVGLKKVIQAASDTEESLNKVREIFGSAAGAVENFSQTAAEGIGASRQEALAMTGEIGNLLVAFGIAEKKAGDMSTQMVQLAADLGSFNNVPTVDALNAIRSAIVGEAEPIRRFGADVRQARLDQIALAEGLEFTKGKMDAQTKAFVVMKAILKDTAKAQGDFKRTSDGLANSSKIMEANIKDLASALGTELIPVAKLAVKSLTLLAKGVKDVIEGFSSGETLDIAKSFGIKEWIASTVLAIDGTNEWAFQTVIASEKARLAIKKANEELAKGGDPKKGTGGGKPEQSAAEKRELALRQEILASLKLQADKLRIINQLKAEGLIPLSEEEQKTKKIFEQYKNAQPILEAIGREHVEIVDNLTEEEWRLNNIRDAQERWKREAEETKQQLFKAAGILNEIAQLASGKRKFSFSGLLGIGAGIAGLIPGGQGVAAALQAGSIAARGFQGGGRPPVGRDVIVGEHGPEIFRADRPGTIIPNSQINNNQKSEYHFHFNVADEMTIKTKVIPIINDYVERQGGKLVSSKVA